LTRASMIEVLNTNFVRTACSAISMDRRPAPRIPATRSRPYRRPAWR
jgi:hypothetical protein